MRPVATTLLMAAILLAGAVAFKFLSLSALPEVDYPTIQVQTFYPGASPEVMTDTVTAPLERQFGEMTDLNRMSSISSGGASVITLQFNLDLGLDVAEQEVQAAINAAGNLLHPDPAKRKDAARARLLLLLDRQAASRLAQMSADASDPEKSEGPRVCPCCRKGLLLFVRRLSPKWAQAP